MIKKRSELGTPHAVIIPGSKTSMADLKWMKEQGFDTAITDLAHKGVSVAGICGGYQILGESIADPLGLEGDRGLLEGLGLLAVKTVISHGKKTVKTSAVPVSKNGFLKDCKETVTGYEIHMGETSVTGDTTALFRLNGGAFDGSVSQGGKVWGTYLHGVFNTPGFRRKWLQSLGWTVSGRPRSLESVQNEQLDYLADVLEANLDMDFIDGIIGL